MHIKNNMKHFIKELLLESGEILKKRFILKSEDQLRFKTPKDIVTTIDMEIEKIIINRINQKCCDDIKIISEEYNPTNIEFFLNEKCFIIDPIDGTNNFIHNIPYFSISIAYSEKGKIITGGVYNPILDEMFLAEKGKGAYLNNKRIFVSKTNELINSLVATGFACLRSNLKKNNLENVIRILPVVRCLRRIGSAALDLCYTAAGRFDAFWELNLNIWDIAAGVIIVEEANGIVSDFNNTQNYIFKKEILASNGLIHSKILELLRN